MRNHWGLTKRLAIPLLIAFSLTGCRTHLILRDRTLETAATLADMNYRQVLDNVARFAHNPATLPSVAVVNGGAVLVSDQGSLGGSGTYAPTITAADQVGGFPIFSLFFNPNMTRNLTENWSMVPVTDIDKVRRLRCAFQILVGSTDDCEDCFDGLEGFIPSEPEKLDCAIPKGWYCVGCKKDVPKNACYVGHYGETYVWVMPYGVEGLSRFTLTVMQLSTSELEEPATKTVLRKYDPEGNLLETDITNEEIDEDAPKSTDMIESGAHLGTPTYPHQHRMLPSRGKTPKQTTGSPKQSRKRGGPQ